MGLFKKKEKKEERSEIPKLPEIPQLPELPEFPETENEDNSMENFGKFSDNDNLEQRREITGQIPQLPRFPNGSLGNKFSQDTIKEAITGKKEEEVKADESAEEMPMMQKPLIKEGTKRESYFPIQKKVKEAEPIFIRIDKFEEGSQMFEEVKTKILEIENMFDEIKKVKEKEERELSLWENEIKKIKEKIERIDNNIFSQIE